MTTPAYLGEFEQLLLLAVLRLDVGRRFSNNDFVGYSLSPTQRDGGFVSFFFGYNY